VKCLSGVPLIVITSNDERDLPPAFVRRCIVLALSQPDLAQVAALHFPDDAATIAAAQALLAQPGMPAPSAAEFLDFIQACREMQVGPQSDSWLRLAEACVLKGRRSGVPARQP
jgi:MoxR-like ATPase